MSNSFLGKLFPYKQPSEFPHVLYPLIVVSQCGTAPLPALPPPVLLNLVKHMSSPVSPWLHFPAICSPPPWNSAEFSPLCSSSCIYILTFCDGISSVLLLSTSSSCVSSEWTQTQQTWQGVKILSSPLLLFSSPMEASSPPSSPLPSPHLSLSSLITSLKLGTPSMHDKVWKLTCTQHELRLRLLTRVSSKLIQTLTDRNLNEIF